MNTKIHFPALVIGTSSIDKINYHQFVGNKNYIHKGYKNVIIVDGYGNFFNLSGTKQVGGVSIIDSILSFNWLVKMEPILKEPVRKISLDEFKNVIIDIIKSHPRHFSNLDDKASLIEAIKKSNSHVELINIF